MPYGRGKEDQELGVESIGQGGITFLANTSNGIWLFKLSKCNLIKATKKFKW